jgi:hypothetical protein
MRWRQDYHLLIIGGVAFAARPSATSTGAATAPVTPGHIVSKGAAYIAMLTAFYVDNGPRLPLLDHLPVLAFWLFPPAVGGPVMARAVMRARRAASGAPGLPGRSGPAEGGAGCPRWSCDGGPDALSAVLSPAR